MPRVRWVIPLRGTSQIVSKKRYETHLGKTHKRINIQQVNETTNIIKHYKTKTSSKEQ